MNKTKTMILPHEMLVIEKICNRILKKWEAFEKRIMRKRSNQIYKNGKSFEFDNYYKGKTIDLDIKEYFE